MLPPKMMRSVRHGRRGRVSSLISSTVTFRRPQIPFPVVWARMSRSLVSDDDLVAKLARLRRRIMEARARCKRKPRKGGEPYQCCLDLI